MVYTEKSGNIIVHTIIKLERGYRGTEGLLSNITLVDRLLLALGTIQGMCWVLRIAATDYTQ